MQVTGERVVEVKLCERMSLTFDSQVPLSLTLTLTLTLILILTLTHELDLRFAGAALVVE